MVISAPRLILIDDSGDWLSTPTHLEISSTAIDVWRCRLGRTADEVEEFGKCLSEQERERAERFRFADKRSQFVTTRARLRQCLALATGTPAAEVEIHIGAAGKPFLAGEARTSEIQFNVSHTDALALIAITRGQAIGIDVESLGRSVQYSRLAEGFFSAREKDAIASLPSEQVPASFFACWTRKEAVLKATGTGIAHGLESFEVATGPEIAHHRTELQSAAGSTETWCLETLPCGPGFAAALAYQKHPVEIRLWY